MSSQESKQVKIKKINPKFSLETQSIRFKLLYFGCKKTYGISFEKSGILRKVERDGNNNQKKMDERLNVDNYTTGRPEGPSWELYVFSKNQH